MHNNLYYRKLIGSGWYQHSRGHPRLCGGVGLAACGTHGREDNYMYMGEWARDENVGDLARSFGAYRSVIPPVSYRIPG